MSNIAIVYASRYGAAKQVSELIASHLTEGADLLNVNDEIRLSDNHEIILLGSGIYANKFLPEMEDFIKKNESALLSRKVLLFGVAMRLTMMLDRYDYLNPAVKEMLHGRMDFQSLNDEDKCRLEKYYTARNFTEEQKIERRNLGTRYQRMSAELLQQGSHYIKKTLKNSKSPPTLLSRLGGICKVYLFLFSRRCFADESLNNFLFLHRLITIACLNLLQLGYDIHAVYNLTEDCMSVIEPRRRYCCDEKLASVCAWACICHSEKTGNIELKILVKFIFERASPPY